ncbi:hypothetical protein Tsubulata_050204 [Turnera subulata]|uniref:Cytochrome P450 n=1 Tax=Turnera subulata TaxID=218843 RepID=A0A9Q0GH78_9ROSI|nr:hypothetical protein Tsubulata_050204 [Turnera subulata]
MASLPSQPAIIPPAAISFVSTNAIATTFAFVVVVYFLWRISNNTLTKASNKKMAPKVRGGLPLIGHIRMFGSKPTHRVLSDMADKYGPIFSFNIGVHPTLVVNNWELAKECLSTNDKAFANRPKTLASEILTYDGAIFGFASYGNLWRQQRKVVSTEFLSNLRVDAMRGVIDNEIRTSLKELYKLWCNNNNSNDSGKGVKVEMRGFFGDLSTNVLLRTIVGETLGYGPTGDVNGWGQGLRKFSQYSAKSVMSDVLPFLRFLDLGGHEKAMRKVQKEIDAIGEEWLADHKQKRLNSGAGKGENDLMDILLKLFEEGRVDIDRDPDTLIKGATLVKKQFCHLQGSSHSLQTSSSIQTEVIASVEDPCTTSELNPGHKSLLAKYGMKLASASSVRLMISAVLLMN